MQRDGLMPQRLRWILAVLAATPAEASAHAGRIAPPDHVWHHWSTEPLVLLGLAVAAFAYVRGVRLPDARGRHRRGAATSAVPPWRLASFAAGMLAVAIALVSPVDAMGETLFSAHMAQHLLLMTVAPPLLLLGLPGLAWLRALPRPARRPVTRWWRRRRLLRRLVVVLTAPVTAVVLHMVAIWMWHLPALYERAVMNDAVHAVEHASFLGTGLLFWWVAAGSWVWPGKQHANPLTGLMAVFITAMHSGLLGALLTLAPTPWYRVHEAGATLWGITLLEDQQLAGLIMWVPGGLLYTAAAALLFGAWMAHAGRLTRRALGNGVANTAVVTATGRRITAALVVLVLLGACRREPVPELMYGNAQRGKAIVAAYGCGSCHIIDGIRSARGQVGPPLSGVGARSMLAGRLANTPENLVRWLMDPPAVDSATAMPDLVNDVRTARDIAAYLYTLR